MTNLIPASWIDPRKRQLLPQRRESFVALMRGLDSIQVEDHGWQTVQNFVSLHGLGKARIFFIGNGGSAAIASHMAIDWSKNGQFPTFGPGDAASLTCVSNDLGFEHVYAHQIKRHGSMSDLLFAISSSGMSPDILTAVEMAQSKCMNVVTLTGFGPGNFLRGKGQVNFYVPSSQYGTVEIAHLAILHSILDEAIANDRR